MLLFGLLLAAQCGGDRVLRKELGRLPALGRRALKVALPLMQDVAAGAPKVVFLGGGPMYGVACEAMLKLTEMAQRPTVAYHPLEFRHGPISAVGPGTVAVLLGSRAGARLETALVRDLRRQGVTVVRLRDEESGGGEADVDVTLSSGLSDAARAVLYLPFVHALAYWRAMGAGFDPDRPVHLTPVVQLKQAAEKAHLRHA
jgi:glucosamine--fructose-6-phosphate aminotransferase (isomerizing)